MKLNIIKVLNTIESEEATIIMLTDPNAFWNRTNEDELRDEYLCYKQETEWKNDYTWQAIEWYEKHGYDYSDLVKSLKKVMTFDEWLAQRKEIMSKYLVA